MAEHPKLIIATQDRVFHRDVLDEVDPEMSADQWGMSSPIPGTRIIGTWEIYHNITLALTVREDGHYCIFRSINRRNYTLVHEHASQIFGIFYIDYGRAVFSAADGWQETHDTGVSWSALGITGDAPLCRACAVVSKARGTWDLVAYGEDHVLYQAEYPDGEWSEAYDTTEIWTDKWYPAISGGPLGVLAGAGAKLLRWDRVSSDWVIVQEVGGIIKAIVISNQSNVPTFLIEVEQTDDSSLSKLYWSYDFGDSLVADMNRASPIASVQSVYPTGENTRRTMFVVLGKRVAGGQAAYKIVEGR